MLKPRPTKMINVPEEFIPELELYLEFLQHRADNAASHEAEGSAVLATGDVGDSPLWADAEVQTLARVRTITAHNYVRIMNAVVDNGRIGEWLSLDDLANVTGIDRANLRTFGTQLHRYINSVYGQRHAPITRIWGDKIKRDRVAYYRVSEECAEQWRRVGTK